MSKRQLIFLVPILLSFSLLACGGDGTIIAGSDSSSAGQTVYSISGTVSGTVPGGVTVTLSGSGSATTTTAADGSYVFAGVANGNYTVTAILTGNTFTPASRTATVNGADVAGLDFVSSASSWMWVSGPDTVAAAQVGNYGTKGLAAASNIPGGRERAASCVDRSGNVWIFGGYGYDSTGNLDCLSDLWKYDGSNWTWVSGSDRARQAGSYGTKGVAAPGNVPGARVGAVSWVDSSGNLWLFGGESRETGLVYRNDLWKFDGTNWTWISGSDSAGQSGSYGTLGVTTPGNFPGARAFATSWVDSSGNFWLFGGVLVDSGVCYAFNDLWKFDGTNWTWISGKNGIDQAGSYGTKGVAAPGNVPGGREGAASWVDSSGNFWIFGGMGLDSVGSYYLLNDLWKYDGHNWTWVSGGNTADQAGSYGTIGIAAPGNVPGGRQYAASWTDSSGNFWLFGGWTFEPPAWADYRNDLWKFDGTNWTWVSGSDSSEQAGSYGTQGVADVNNVPGARVGAVAWVDSSGNLRLFGGYAFDSAGTDGYLNDLWRY